MRRAPRAAQRGGKKDAGGRVFFPPRAVRRAPRADRRPGFGRRTGRAEPAGRRISFAFLIIFALIFKGINN